MMKRVSAVLNSHEATRAAAAAARPCATPAALSATLTASPSSAAPPHARTFAAADSPAAASVHHITVTSDLNDLANIWPRTGQMGEAHCHVFQRAELLQVWCDTVGKVRGTLPCFVAVHDTQERPLMLLPLGIERRLGVRILRFLDADVVDYNGPIVFPHTPDWDAAEFHALWQRICAALPAFDVALLQKMPHRVGDLPNPLMRLGALREPVSGHQLSRAPTWKEQEARLPHKASTQRKGRQLAKLGAVSFEVAEQPDDGHAFLEAMIEQKARRFAETRVPGFEVPGKLAFFREATRRLAPLGLIHLSAMKVGDAIVATHWGLLSDDRLYHLMPAYAGGAWTRYSPGRMLNDFLVQWSHERGLMVDFGIGDESYKLDYCDITVPLHGLAQPRTAAGHAYLQVLQGLERLRGTRVWQTLRPLKWMVKRALRRD
jgi:CelD/BcsL family acetyltransferase involved in cellulose biosynthesis